ncbi:uncharacterized protein PSANT_04565 [Moesziomyces antarcticus]|uniref:Uncharacterized protein n=1 Tax=Pseudozyma antarctica TaxID=84753 RepID=A0A5C3FU36_PSEA2|nr:uncharacterized protein PSANT_04565 [Moesziomyces antarcticus]
MTCFQVPALCSSSTADNDLSSASRAYGQNTAGLQHSCETRLAPCQLLHTLHCCGAALGPQQHPDAATLVPSFGNVYGPPPGFESALSVAPPSSVHTIRLVHAIFPTATLHASNLRPLSLHCIHLTASCIHASERLFISPSATCTAR